MWNKTPEDFPQELNCEVWEENWEAVSIYTKNASQWRLGPNGPFSIDMIVFRHELDRRGYDRVEYDEMLWALNIIESAALRKMTGE